MHEIVAFLTIEAIYQSKLSNTCSLWLINILLSIIYPLIVADTLFVILAMHTATFACFLWFKPIKKPLPHITSPSY